MTNATKDDTVNRLHAEFESLILEAQQIATSYKDMSDDTQRELEELEFGDETMRRILTDESKRVRAYRGHSGNVVTIDPRQDSESPTKRLILADVLEVLWKGYRK